MLLAGCPQLGDRAGLDANATVSDVGAGGDSGAIADGGAKADTGSTAGSDAAAASDAGSSPDTGSLPDTGALITHPTNILNNGGFELGLMCYGNWIWSQTGKDYKGDYDFLLSADAHSGSRALELKCTGTDCGGGAKSAIYTQKIHTPRSQAYKLTVWSKCTAGKNTYFYTPSAAAGDYSKPLSCAGSWATNDISFTSSATADYLYFYFYNADTGSLLLDDVTLTYDDGTVPAQTVHHAGKREVSVTGQRVVVDGAAYLALGYFNVPYEDLEAAVAAGANTVTTLGLDEMADCFNTDRGKYADKAFELGVGVLPDSTTTARLDTPDVFPQVMDFFAPQLANIGWYLVDEPDQADVTWYYITAANLVAEHDQARTKTSLPIVVDLQRASWEKASVDQPYAGSADVFMAEPYGDDFSGVTHAMGVFQTLGAKPVWLAQDPVTASLIVPKAWFAVVSGATGILYFTWGDFQQDAAKDKKAAAAQAFSELKGFSDVLFDADATSQVGAPAGISFIARTHQGKTYIAAVNPTAAKVQGDFTLSGLGAGKTVTVMFESRTLTSAAGKFSDSFDGVARHVYVVE
jgi:YD repeat-containing protein